jgi:hypothetical protein
LFVVDDLAGSLFLMGLLSEFVGDVALGRRDWTDLFWERVDLVDNAKPLKQPKLFLRN